MSVTTIEMPDLQLRVPHAANIIERRLWGLWENQYDLAPVSHSLDEVPRAKATYKHIAQVSIMGKMVDFHEVEYGEPVHLPDPEDDVYQIVSPLTINAAKRVGRTTDDLLFLYGPLYDKQGRIRGVKGLARPHFQQREGFTEQVNYKEIVEQLKDVQSVSPAPTSIYRTPLGPNEAPYYTATGERPALTIPMAAEEEHKVTLDYQDYGNVNIGLTARFGGIPVYEQPILRGVKNHDASKAYDRVMRPVANPSILLALGQDALRGGYVMHDFGVRIGDQDDPRYGVAVGGRSLLIPSQKMLEEPYF